MALGKPDPRYTPSRQARRSFRLALRISLVFVGILWVIFVFDSLFGLRLGRFGLRPGSIPGLIGLVTAPLLHANFQHILSNTFPLFLSLTATLYLYPRSSIRVIPMVWLGSGALAWFIGRPNLHFGASGLIYGLLAYVFVSGILRKDMRSVSVSLLIGFLYVQWSGACCQFGHRCHGKCTSQAPFSGFCSLLCLVNGTGLRCCVTTGKTMTPFPGGILSLTTTISTSLISANRV